MGTVPKANSQRTSLELCMDTEEGEFLSSFSSWILSHGNPNAELNLPCSGHVGVAHEEEGKQGRLPRRTGAKGSRVLDRHS